MALDQWRPSEIAGGEFRQFPNEIMLKVILGRYTAERVQVSAGVSVLDVGCFRGNNMVPFFDRGCKCHGVEINADMVEIGRAHV